MREVGVISFAQSAVARDASHNEVEMLVPTIHAALRFMETTSTNGAAARATSG